MVDILQILLDILKVDDVLFVVRGRGAVSEIRSNSLHARQKDKWITIGDNDGPCHMHLDSELICEAQFVTRKKPERTVFAVEFYDASRERALGAFFTKMYENGRIVEQRKRLYDDLVSKYGSSRIYLT